MLGSGAADEGQRNAECKVRKGLNGEDKAHGKISGCKQAAESASRLCARQEGELAREG